MWYRMCTSQGASTTRHKRRQSAFTLIELLVVVAILGLLTAILLPSLSRAREQARGTVCKTNQKQLAFAATLYVMEYKVLPATQSTFWLNAQRCAPDQRSHYWAIPRQTRLDLTNWVWDGANQSRSNPDDKDFIQDVPKRGTLFKYARDEKVYVCPGQRKGRPVDTPLGGDGNGRLDYAMNAYVGYKSLEDMRGRVMGIRGSTRIRRWPAYQMVLFVEEHPYYHLGRNLEGNFNVTDKIVARHSVIVRDSVTKGRTNIAYADGRVESPLYDLSTDATTLFGKLGFPISGNDIAADFLLEFVPTIKPVF